MPDLSPLVNKTVSLKFSGAEIRLDLSHALFSSYDIDQGTRLLLKLVGKDPALGRAGRILDEGCGTGVIGLAAAKAFPEAEVVLRDRDSLAVAFAERNRLSNKLRGRTAWEDPAGGASRLAAPAPKVGWGLLAAGGEGGPFDYVLSNLPAKAGGPVLAAFFARLPSLLSPEGRAGVVIVNTLAESARSWIGAAGLRPEAEERGSGHTAFVVGRGGDTPAGAAPSPIARPETGSSAEAAPAAAPGAAPLAAIDLGPYHRCESRFAAAGSSYPARGFWGLPEFDTLSFSSQLLADLAAKAAAGSLVRDLLVAEPGIGHFPLWAAGVLGPERVVAASRDLLALAAVGANLAALPERRRPAYRAVDALSPEALAPASFDLLAEVPDIVPEYDWISPAWERASRVLKSGAAYVVSCPPTELGRFEKRRPPGWRLLQEKRRKGAAAAAWRKA